MFTWLLLDDAFKYQGKEPESIEEIADDPIVGLFKVSGFRIQGSEDNAGYILIGEKWVTHGQVALDSPKITKNLAYKFFDELEEAITNARNEVEAYMNGNAAPKYEQLEIGFDAKEETDHFSEENI